MYYAIAFGMLVSFFLVNLREGTDATREELA